MKAGITISRKPHFHGKAFKRWSYQVSGIWRTGTAREDNAGLWLLERSRMHHAESISWSMKKEG